jgi:ATP-dependent Clp protease ATP-binding subunit ClpC
MPSIKLEVPTLVRDITVEGKNYYHLRPLFVNHPVATNRRYEQAIVQYKNEIRHFFKGFSLNRTNADRLLWYLFNPAIHYEKTPVYIKLGQMVIDDQVTAVHFSMRGHDFVCLPGMYDFMFIANKSRDGKVWLKDEVNRVCKTLFQNIKTDKGDDFRPEDFFAGRREFVTTVTLNVNIGFGGFKFEKSRDAWYFARLQASLDFDGGIEIERVGQNLNNLYPAGLHRAFYRDEPAARIHQLLFEEGSTPLALVGPEGVGKHTLVHEALRRYLVKPGKEQPLRIWQIDPTRIIAGMSIVGMWQKRFEAIIRYARKDGEVSRADKLLFDNPIALLRIGKSAKNNMTLSDVLRSYLEKRQLQVLIIASPQEWKVIQERDRRFSDLFQVIRVAEPDPETATRIVLQKRRALELEHEVVITIQAVEQLFTLHRNYLNNRALPGSVIRLLQQLSVKYRSSVVDVPEVRAEFKSFSGLEEMIFDSSRRFEEGEAEKRIAQRLVGQPQAVKVLAEAVHLIKAKLADKTKPISSFLFIGPTGVGKTQAAKVLAQYLMGSEEHLLRFDMNEYIDDYAVSRLIGDYYQPEGQLTGKVRYQPFSVLLLDEIEKAHPKVHDLLLQVLDDGRLTDSLGRTVDFTNTIIIMTSNLGARQVAQQLGYQGAGGQDQAIYRKAVENNFRPEFINRIDNIIVFNQLAIEHMLGIARLQIKELLQRDGFVRRTTILNISREALDWVARRGFNPRMGGRALRRQIEKDLTALSAEQLLSTHTETPIVLDIVLEDGRLAPNIANLDFVEPLPDDWLPELPDETRGKRFYGSLRKEIEEIERKIEAMEAGPENDSDPVIIVPSRQNGAGLNWQYYDFKNKVLEAKEQINTTMLGFRDKYFAAAPAIPLRLKRGHLVVKRDFGTKGMRENIKDRLFQEEGIKELSLAYQFANAQFDSLKTEFINNYVHVSLLKLFAKGFLAGHTDTIRLKIQSLITGLGEREVAFLLEKYVMLLQALDIQHDLDEENQLITAEGHSLTALLRGETGIHLFYAAHTNPLPVRVSLWKDQERQGAESDFQVVRVYDGGQTLTDLRSGFSNAMNLTSQEFKLLLFAGLQSRE